MGDTDVDVDLDSVLNVILPLELYKLPSFPAEHSFTRLHNLLLTQFTEYHPQNIISPSFLFSISEILSSQVQFCHKNILPLVLRRLRTWRLLSLEEKTRDALEDLALDLAALVNARSCPTEPRSIPPRMRIRWIGVEESEAESGRKPDALDPPDESVQQLDRRSCISVSPICPNVPLHEMASYRSGCCACHRPRNHYGAGDPSQPQTPMAILPPFSPATKVPYANVVTTLLPLSPRKTSRKVERREDDENIPVLPSQNILLPRDKSSSRNRAHTLSAIRPTITRTKSATAHPAPLSRSSFSYNSAYSLASSKPNTSNSNSSFSTQSNIAKASASRSSSSVTLVTAQPHALAARPTSHLAFRTSPTKVKSRVGTLGSVSRDFSKLKTTGKPSASTNNRDFSTLARRTPKKVE